MTVTPTDSLDQLASEPRRDRRGTDGVSAKRLRECALPLGQCGDPPRPERVRGGTPSRLRPRDRGTGREAGNAREHRVLEIEDTVLAAKQLMALAMVELPDLTALGTKPVSDDALTHAVTLGVDTFIRAHRPS